MQVVSATEVSGYLAKISPYMYTITFNSANKYFSFFFFANKYFSIEVIFQNLHSLWFVGIEIALEKNDVLFLTRRKHTMART